MAASQKAKSGKGNQDVKMKGATKEGREDEESSGKEVSTSWRCSESEDGALLINGALCEVAQAAHGRYLSQWNRGGGITLIKICRTGVGITRSGKSP